jgi:predicted S18 family serine protease
VAPNERIDADVGANRKVTDRISYEVKAKSRRLLDKVKYYTTETENILKEIRQDLSQLREEWNSQQATWQNKAGREMDEVNDSVRLVEERVARLVEDRVTEIQAAAKNSIQKVNTEIKNLREQLAAREVNDGAIPNQVLAVMAGDV